MSSNKTTKILQPDIPFRVADEDGLPIESLEGIIFYVTAIGRTSSMHYMGYSIDENSLRFLSLGKCSTALEDTYCYLESNEADKWTKIFLAKIL